MEDFFLISGKYELSFPFRSMTYDFLISTIQKNEIEQHPWKISVL